jgi:hypothetical protein
MVEMTAMYLPSRFFLNLPVFSLANGAVDF